MNSWDDPQRRERTAPDTFPDKRTGEPRQFYVYLPSRLIRDNCLSTDARFLVGLFRTFTRNVNEPAYPGDTSLLAITGWSRKRLMKVIREVKVYPGVCIRQRKEKGHFGRREVFLPKWLFHDRCSNPALR